MDGADFISEDVTYNGHDYLNSEGLIDAYYKLLNVGFRPGLAAGTDYPCGIGELGALLTYSQVAAGQMSYVNSINGISAGRTVISRTGHVEFLNLVVNGSATPGDQVNLAAAGDVPVSVQWTATENLSGRLEIVVNGSTVASKNVNGTSDSLTTTVNFPKSGWVVARRMEGGEHQVHTAAVFVIVNGAPVRASRTDAQFFVDWINNLLTRTSPGGNWNRYFPTNLAAAQARYQAAIGWASFSYRRSHSSG